MLILGEFKFYQFVIVTLATWMIADGFIKYFYRQSGQTFLKLFIRVVIWGGMVIVAVFPSITNNFASFVGMAGNINAVILTGFLLVFLLIFKILSVVERIEQNITVIVRREALRDLSKDKP